MEKIKRVIIKDFAEAQKTHDYLGEHVKEHTKGGEEIEYMTELDRSLKNKPDINVIYPVGEGVYIHVIKQKGKETQYMGIEPVLTEEEEQLYEKAMDKMIEVAHLLPVPPDASKIGDILVKVYDMVVTKNKSDVTGIKGMFSSKILLTEYQYDTIKYFMLRNRTGYAKLEPLLKDPYLEDIHCVGLGGIQAIHKMFDMIHTNIIFSTDEELDKYIVETSERVERPTSDAHSVVDAMMPDGSRANFIYGRDISLEGSSFTLRKFFDVPVSITQVVNWGTMSAQVAAYLWICMENGMNLFVCGETASGKTTTLNALCAFIKPEDKIFTVENTPEVKMPHKCWQHLLTREAGKNTDVTYEMLLIAALRSRPNYIIVGEIRGEEGSVAFQAMQTGHPVLATFHAGNTATMIQRLTGEPISVPITFIDNLNLSLIQMAVSHGGRVVRRVLSITEIERYYAPANKMVTREVFVWDSINDGHSFKGMFNSYILEQKIATVLGYEDPRDIYKELDLRENIIKKMIETKIFDYYDVWEVLKNFQMGGRDTLPFEVPM